MEGKDYEEINESSYYINKSDTLANNTEICDKSVTKNEEESVIQDSGDSSYDMNEYLKKNQEQNSGIKSTFLKVPIEQSKYSVSPLHNMRPSILESYNNTYKIVEEDGDKIFYKPHKRVNVAENIRKNSIVAACTFGGVMVTGTVMYILLKVR